MSRLEDFEIFWKLLIGRKVNKKRLKKFILKLKLSSPPKNYPIDLIYFIGKQEKRNMFLILKGG